MKKITSFLALFLMFLGVSLQASADALPQLTEDPANPKWYYVQSYRSGKYLGHDAEGKVLQVADFSEASLWYFLKSGDAVLLCSGSEGNLQFTASDSQTLTANGTPMYIVQHDFNKCGLSICKNPTIQGGDCIDANNDNDGTGWWSPNEGDNEGTTWRMINVSDFALNIENDFNSKLMGTYADTPEARNAVEKGKAISLNDAAAFIDFVNTTMSTLAVKMPEAGKTYLVKSCYVEYFKKQGVEKALCDDTTTPMWNTLNKADKSFYWNIVPTTDGYTFQNVASSKYIKALGEVAADAATIKMEAVGVNKWKLTLNGEAFHTNGHDGGSGVSGNIVNWYDDPLGACQWYVEEIEYTEPADVVYEYYIGNEMVYSQKTTQLVGGDFELPYSNVFFDATIETEGKVQKGSVVKVACVEKNVPFLVTTDTKNPVWYIIDIHGQNCYWNATAEAGKIKTIEVSGESSLDELSKDDYQWCFVGNAVAGYKIYNKVKGFGEALTNAADYVNFAPAAEAIEWRLAQSSSLEGAVCFSDGRNYINHQEVDQNGGTLKYHGRTDDGSSCRLTTRADNLLALANSVKPVYVGAVGTNSYFQNVDNAEAFNSAYNAVVADKNNVELYDVLKTQIEKAQAGGLVKLSVNQYYRFKNYCRNTSIDNEVHPGLGGYMSTTHFKQQDTNVTCATDKLDDAGSLWMLESNGEFYNIKNLNSGKYLGVTSARPCEYLTLVTNKTEAGLYDVQSLGDAQYFFVCANGPNQNDNKLHVSNGVMNYVGALNDPSAWYLITATEFEVNMNKVEGATDTWSTLHLPFGVQLNGVQAYTGKAGEGVMNLTEVKKEVPANNAVILKGTADKYMLSITTATGDLKNNDLKGSNVAPTKKAGYTYLVLSAPNGEVGLFNARNLSLAANKAYYEVAEGGVQAVQGLKFVFGEATGVESVETESNEPAVVYDLSGRRVLNPSNGVYIVNGKKVYVK